MQQKLICQGGIQVNSANSNTGPGATSVFVDLPNGPKPGTVWAVDSFGCIFSALNGASLQAVQSPWSNIYLVPISASTPANDSFGNLDLSARGTPLCQFDNLNNLFTSFSPAAGYGFMAGKGPLIVPAGFTLRAIVSGTNGTGLAPFDADFLLLLFAQLRILDQQ